MFPLKDNVPSKTFPFVNYLFIAINIAIFLHEWKLSEAGQLEAFIIQNGLVPARFFSAPVEQVSKIFSSMFLHGSWAHVIGNMWFLFIFGDNVEDRVGHFRYVFYYLLMGVGAALAQLFANPSSALPMVGASGAVAGILGSYFVLFPHARVQTFFIFIFIIRIIEIPAFFYLGLWFFTQALNSFGSLTVGVTRGDVGGVAWWAHVGGFVTGFVAVQFFKKKRKTNHPFF